MKDLVDSMYGHLKVRMVNSSGKTVDEIDFGKNAISYRAKSVMSRLLGGGLSGAVAPDTGFDFDWGSDLHALRITGMAVGNGGHLIYDGSTSSTNSLDKIANSIAVDGGSTLSDPLQPAMPFIPASGDWGYAGNPGQGVPGTFYELVENGNVPWDGTVSIKDNKVGVAQANTTLYSETFRFPLDSADGILYPTNTEVQFKATLPLGVLNDTTSQWGFSQQAANIVSEAALISGYVPDFATITGAGPDLGQLYSTDGGDPSGGNFDTTSWTSRKDFSQGTTARSWGTLPPDTLLPDNWTSGTGNTWNMLSRKTFPSLIKTPAFSLVFVWTIGF